MLVYGDHRERVHPKERLDRIAEKLGQVARMPAGIDRHSALVGALIDAGQLLQGVADAGLPGEQPLDVFLHRLAHCVVRSWDSGFCDVGDLPALPSLDRQEPIELRVPEGFAFYAVYPEAYIDAARRLTLSAPPRVIGIRSIGTTLGAVVAAALDSRPAISVRPFGHPFARQVELPPELLEPDAHYVIVDEGPGLSGSSFGGVADWLQSQGVPLDRIAFLPSHGKDVGPQASSAHRRRWSEAQRIAADFGGRLDELARGWAAERIGPNDSCRFVGLGAIGERKLGMARALHSAGFMRAPIALVHGFLVERGGDDAEPLAPDEKPVAELGRYIAARAQLFSAKELYGAGTALLSEMCRRNISLALGEGFASPDGEELELRVHRTWTDNRLDRRNWLRTSQGRLIKLQAVDQGHNLVGCQDPAWDVAGAIAEFDLDGEQADALSRTIERCGRRVDRELLAFYRVAYAAFRLGEAMLAQSAEAERYASMLRNLLHQHVFSATAHGSSVG